VGNRYPGPPNYGVKGDEDGMRKLAKALEKDADQLREGATRARKAFARHKSKGSFVDVWEAKLDSGLGKFPALSKDLNGLAAALKKAAGTVEDDRRQARQRYEAEQRRLEAAAAAEQQP